MARKELASLLEGRTWADSLLSVPKVAQSMQMPLVYAELGFGDGSVRANSSLDIAIAIVMVDVRQMMVTPSTVRTLYVPKGAAIAKLCRW